MICLSETQSLFFTVTGTLAVPKDVEFMYAYDGAISGYKVNGKEVRLVVALEVDEGDHTLTTDKDMGDELSSQVLEYERTDFTEMGEGD